jgi:hypothetical protein
LFFPVFTGGLEAAGDGEYPGGEDGIAQSCHQFEGGVIDYQLFIVA